MVNFKMNDYDCIFEDKTMKLKMKYVNKIVKFSEES